jgi:hypothetical protein
MRFFDGYCLDVPLALAAAKELSTLCLPGRNPHPVRDPTGHSYHVGPLPVATDASWLADRDKPLRMLFKSLILLSAAGVKVRERKNAAAARYAVRAAALLRELIKAQDSTIERAQGMSPATIAEHAEAATGIPAELERRRLDSLNLCSISFSDQFSREAVRTV